MTRPKVSIGIPVFNGERYLAQTLDAFLAQTFQDFEIVISDNASTDRTADICREYSARDGRIKYLRHPQNLGAAVNYRTCFENASGIYFKWAASDDLPGRTVLEQSVRVLDEHPDVVLVHPRTMVIDEHGDALAPFDDELDLRDPSPAVRGIQALERVGRCNPVYGLTRPEVLRRTNLLGSFLGSDKALLFELSLHGRFWELPERLFFRRMHPGAFSSQHDNEALTAFYNPAKARTVAFFRWRHLREHAAAVWRAPVTAVDKVHLLAYLVRSAIWQRASLRHEVAVALRQLPRGSFAVQKPAPK